MVKNDYIIGDTLIECNPTEDKEMMFKLKKIRKSYGMTQKQISELLGIPLNTWCQWERGRRTPPPYILRLISYSLEFKMNEKK